MADLQAETLAAIRGAPASTLLGESSKNALTLVKPEFGQGKNSYHKFTTNYLGLVDEHTMPKFKSGQRYELLIILMDKFKELDKDLELFKLDLSLNLQTPSTNTRSKKFISSNDTSDSDDSVVTDAEKLYWNLLNQRKAFLKHIRNSLEGDIYQKWSQAVTETLLVSSLEDKSTLKNIINKFLSKVLPVNLAIVTKKYLTTTKKPMSMRSMEWFERLLALNYYLDVLHGIGQDVRPFNEQEMINEIILGNLPPRWQGQIYLQHGTKKFEKISELLDVLQGIDCATDINMLNTEFSRINPYNNNNNPNGRQQYVNRESNEGKPPRKKIGPA